MEAAVEGASLGQCTAPHPVVAGFNATTFENLSGALNRLVLQPARTTISQNIAEGMKFARVPEPGACKWCLMLASRGAAYSADTAGMTAATRYHDNCRCVAVEVGRGGGSVAGHQP